ncbi:MAG: hypothetical protein JWO38_7755 [Gemmataceae bacterium]|nr:hypothetical protein [Gemmataceae bacterium]
MTRSLVVALILILAVTGRPSAAPPPEDGSALRVGAKAATGYPFPKYSGVVTTVDNDSITIQGFGHIIGGWKSCEWNDARTERTSTGNPVTLYFADRELTCVRLVETRDALILTAADGKVTVFRRVDQLPRRFKATTALAAGKTRPELLPGQSYRLADVRVGDEVYIGCRQVDGADGCDTIWIERRPGGHVPMAPGERPDDHPRPYSQWANALQDLDERGIPLPDKFLTPWELKARQARIAPPPRVAVPRIPPAAP